MSTTLSRDGSPVAMSHRQVLESLSGLLLGMFVSILAGTVVSTSMPRIISELHGDQTAYTWVVTSTLLATTVSTPIWGKLADLLNRKLLIQLALVIFVAGSAMAGFSQDTSMLIGFRVIQGLGAGGLTALSQIIMADIISPRERGRYMGLFGGVMAVGTVGGPLIGGLLTDSVGWRWNFFVGVPVAVAAIILLQVTLRLPKRPARKVRIDYLGAIFLAAGVSLLLIWVSLAGKNFDWWSAETMWMVGGSIALIIATIVTELVVKEPIIPLGMFKNRTFTLAVIASISVGVAMFGTSVFLGQYMQLARGATPTESGLLTLPMILGLLLSSMIVGNLISRFGKWKGFMIVGSLLLTAGLYLMSTIEYDTNYWLVSLYMLVLGAGVGMVMQNLVLIVQNTVRPDQLGAASSNVAFFRSLGGTIGVSVMGSLLGTAVKDMMADRHQELLTAVAKLGAKGVAAAKSLQSGTLPEVNTLPVPIRTIVESVYGQAVAGIFLVAVPLAIISVIAILFLPNITLGSKTAIERMREENGETPLEAAEENAMEVAEALIGAPATGSVAAVRGDAGEGTAGNGRSTATL
ncbi:drug resistance transporter, EmrB/QacA subfamily [Leifsonia sp. 21MFCrub1.1]|nr:MDR family MFS transporter [Leifsonia sp. 21MFCrub1.1]SEB11992.1 drug resistance transporter, EmrB/QacA subfamily [Leifsonia sp. 21MFCrub1.1]